MIFLDTNVVAETMKPVPAQFVVDWLAANDKELAVSTVVISELAFGIERIRERERSPHLAKQLAVWRQRMSGRIFGFDEDAALICGRLMGEQSRAGRPMSTADGMIAAIALRNSAQLATRNVGHFFLPGLEIINPWTQR